MAKKIKRPTPVKAEKAAGVVVRECVEADKVLPPEDGGRRSEVGGQKTDAVVLRCDGARVQLDGNADAAAVALVLQTGWNRAQSGLVEIMRFGATLLAVREWLENLDSLQQRFSSSGHGGDRRSGTGIKAWLADHCPEINYKTAYGYMCAAAGLRREARLAEDVPLLAMMGEDPIPEARAEKLRKRVQAILAGSTLGLLREAASAPVAVAKGGARDGAGKKAAEADAVRDAGAAWAVIGGKIDLAVGWKFTRFLPAAVAREALSTVTTLQAALKARLDELGQEA
jgi:hypothetical protein